MGLVWEGGYETWVVSSDITLYDLFQIPDGDTEFTCKSHGMTRKGLFSFPDPGLRISLDLNVDRALTLLALITQRA
jgi:hypothetical protein